MLTGTLADMLYRYYTLSVDMGTDLLGDMVKPCQGHMYFGGVRFRGGKSPGLWTTPPCSLSNRYPPLTQWDFNKICIGEGAGSLFSQQGEPAH